MPCVTLQALESIQGLLGGQCERALKMCPLTQVADSLEPLSHTEAGEFSLCDEPTYLRPLVSGQVNLAGSCAWE